MNVLYILQNILYELVKWSQEITKVIESHVNIDVVYSDNSAERSDSGKMDIQPVLRRSAKFKTKCNCF